MGAVVRLRRTAGGFTLIEVLVALVVLSVLLTVTGLSMGPIGQRELRFEGERLAQVLSVAREEAQVRGTPIRLETAPEGYRFAARRGGEWRPIVDDRELRWRRWSHATEVRVQRADGRPGVEFGRESVDVPFVIRLAREGEGSVEIHANGIGSFEVR